MACLILIAVLCRFSHAQAVNKEPTDTSDTCFDLQGLIDTQIKAGSKRIVVPSGVYRVKPQHGEHLALRDLKDIEIVAENAEMICTETTRAMTIANCRNVTVRGLTIDYDPLPFTQGRIVALAKDKSWLEFEIIDGYPENLEMRIEIFDSQTGLLKRDTYYGWQPFESLGNRRYRVKKEDGYQYNPQRDIEEIGDILVTNSSDAPGGNIPHAIVCENNIDVELADISLYASNCFGFLEVNCQKSTYRRCKIDRRPLDSDIQPRGLRRLRSLNADAFHSKHAVIGPQILECTAHFQGDDCVNICGDYHMVMKSDGTKLRVLAKHNMNITPGDPLEVVTYAGLRLPDAKALSIQKSIPIEPDELSFLEKQRMNEFFVNGGSRDMFDIQIDREIHLPRGSIIASANRMGNGFKVAGCDFGYNRSRGILIKASHGIVSENRLTQCWEEAIKVSPEYWWLESGSSNDIRITENNISQCRGMGIAVYAHAGNGSIAPPGAHNEIAITNNTIRQTRGTDIWVTSTNQLILNNNDLEDDKPDVKIEQCNNIQTDIEAEFIDTSDIRIQKK